MRDAHRGTGHGGAASRQSVPQRWRLCCARCAASRVLRVARLRDVRARVMRRLVSDRMCRAVKCRWRTDPALAVVGLVAGGGKNRSVRASIGAEALVAAAHPDDVAPKHRHPYGARCALVLRLTAHGASGLLRELLPAFELARRISLQSERHDVAGYRNDANGRSVVVSDDSHRNECSKRVQYSARYRIISVSDAKAPPGEPLSDP